MVLTLGSAGGIRPLLVYGSVLKNGFKCTSKQFNLRLILTILFLTTHNFVFLRSATMTLNLFNGGIWVQFTLIMLLLCLSNKPWK